MEKKEKFALIGKKLGHSYSPQIHQALGSYDYDLIEVPRPEDLAQLIEDPAYGGYNITIPYKEVAYKLCDRLSPQARALKNVNTLVKRQGLIEGHNTDYDGLKKSLEKNKISPKNKIIGILGNGGAAKTARLLVQDMGVRQVKIIARTGPINFEDINSYKDIQILINSTPVGMYPNNGQVLVDLKKLTMLESLVDLIYNPYYTRLGLEAQDLGLQVVNGLEMLVYQAHKGAELFLNKEIEEDQADKVYDQIKKSALNIALIGMPGVGKTTYGKILSKKTARPLYSTDQAIEERTGRTCQDIILEDGEEAFRAIETQVLEDLSKKSGIIIDCGGGIVTRPANSYLLRQNSIIYWLKRPLGKLDKANRPLSQARSLENIYNERKDLYRSWSHEVIDLD